MYCWPRISNGFSDEVDKFVEAAVNHARQSGANRSILCPCKDCNNEMATYDGDVIRSHLVRRGFVSDYTVWVHHGEVMVDDGNEWHDAVDDQLPAADDQCGFNVWMQDDLANEQARGDDGGGVDNDDVDTCGVDNDDGGAGDEGDAENFDHLEQMLRDFGPEILQQKKGLENLERVKASSRATVYGVDKGCPKQWTLLRFVLELLLLKAKYGWSDCSFDDLLHLLSSVLPLPNLVPSNTYHAKKVINPLTMGVEKIDACPNHCILFRGKTFGGLDKCPRCGASRYKDNDVYSGGEAVTGNKRSKKGSKKAVPQSQPPEDTPLGNDARKRKIPALVMWYLPVTDRLRRIFLNPKEAALMTWWYDERPVDDDVIAHPADGSQWQDFDRNNPDFSDDPRNVRFALSTDGMNPFNERTSKHSTWPVILTMYNIPTWLCMKRKYLFLTVLVSGPQQPGFDMDVFLEPVMEEFEKLWRTGELMYDAFKKETFTLRAIIFVTINDHPALYALSGQFKGKTGCLVCLDDTKWVFLDGSKKVVYIRNRRFLKQGHKYRSKLYLKYFGDIEEDEDQPPVRRHDGKYVFQMVKNISVVYGKKKIDGTPRDRSIPPIEGVPFKKKSIFFQYLKYWPELEVPHAIDAMHVQKNVFESLIATLMDTAKSKDSLRARRDMEQLKVMPELHPIHDPKTGKYTINQASFNLEREERRGICTSVKGTKVPTGFSANPKKLVSMKDLSFENCKAHDCHMMLTVFLPIAIRAIKPEFLKMAITRMCYFWSRITQKKISKNELNDLHDFVVETQAQLEMCLPPAFFDTMVHLMIHMVHQIQALGPCYLHEMWAYERFMSVLSRYVHNRAYPEGSMIEGYTNEEVIECCQEYLKVQRGIGIPDSRYKNRLAGKGTNGRKVFIDEDYQEVSRAHYAVLAGSKLMDPYISEHLEIISSESHGRRGDWVMKQHRQRVTSWLKDKNIQPGETKDSITISKLAAGPSRQVTSWSSYEINGYTFYTHTKDSKSVNQNSGVRVVAIGEGGKKVDYFGIIEEIWELDYGIEELNVALFRCRWLNKPEINEIGLRVVDLQNIGFNDDPWVLASHVMQVFFMTDPLSIQPPKKKPKHVVIPGKQHIIGVDGVEDVDAYNKFDEMPLFTSFTKKINEVEKKLPKNILPWAERKAVKWKTVSGED